MDALEGLPPLYRKWSQAVLEGPVDPEPRADCPRCPMVTALPPAKTFLPDTKCCTFHPELANFQVGVFFRDPRPDLRIGRELLEAKLRSRIGVTPLGIDRPAEYQQTFHLGDGFGRNRTLRCPYYRDEGSLTCGVWAAREATCATWFCKHEKGRTGRTFWELLRLFMQAADRVVARWCLIEMGLPAKQLAAIDMERWAPGATAPMTPFRYEAMWGEHRFGEHRFYARCAEMAESLEWPDVRRIGGIDVEFRAGLLRHAYEELSRTDVGDDLQPEVTTLVRIQKDAYVLQTYSPYDLQEIPRALVEVLELFDGRPTSEVVASAEERGVDLDPATLRRMVDVGLLAER